MRNFPAAVAFAWLVAISPKAAWPGEATSQANAPSRQAELSRLASEATDALRRQDFATAILGSEKLVRFAPGVAEFHANLGMAYCSVGKFCEATRKCLRLSSSKRPRLPRGLCPSGPGNMVSCQELDGVIGA